MPPASAWTDSGACRMSHATAPAATLPLAGWRVLDLSSAVVGPYATQVLADYGADVTKLEQPSGDIIRWISGRSPTPGMSGKFMHMNRKKRSIALDLKTAAAREAALDRKSKRLNSSH